MIPVVTQIYLELFTAKNFTSLHGGLKKKITKEKKKVGVVEYVK